MAITNVCKGGSSGGGLSPEDQLKLDGIEDNATVDQSDAEIKIAYENNNNTNAFTDTEKAKLQALDPEASIPALDHIFQSGDKTLLTRDFIDLKVDRVLDKANEPVLWDVFKEVGGTFTEIDSCIHSNTSNYIRKITEDSGELFMSVNNSQNNIGLHREFDRSDEITFTVAELPSINYLSFYGVYNNTMIFNVTSGVLVMITFDNSYTNLQDVVDNVIIDVVDMSSMITSTGLFNVTIDGVYFTPYVTASWDNVLFLDWNDAPLLANVQTFDLSSIPYIASDLVGEKFITMNGLFLSRGSLYNPQTGDLVSLIEYKDHNKNFSCNHYKGKDYVTFSKNTIGVVNPDKTVDVIDRSNQNIPISSRNIIQYEAINIYSVETSGSNIRSAGYYKDDVFIATTERLFGQSNENRYKYADQNLFTNGGYIGVNINSTNEAYYTKFIENISDIFTIKACVSPSEEIDYYVKLQKIRTIIMRLNYNRVTKKLFDISNKDINNFGSIEITEEDKKEILKQLNNNKECFVDVETQSYYFKQYFDSVKHRAELKAMKKELLRDLDPYRETHLQNRLIADGVIVSIDTDYNNAIDLYYNGLMDMLKTFDNCSEQSMFKVIVVDVLSELEEECVFELVKPFFVK